MKQVAILVVVVAAIIINIMVTEEPTPVQVEVVQSPVYIGTDSHEFVCADRFGEESTYTIPLPKTLELDEEQLEYLGKEFCDSLDYVEYVLDVSEPIEQ